MLQVRDSQGLLSSFWNQTYWLHRGLMVGSGRNFGYHLVQSQAALPSHPHYLLELCGPEPQPWQGGGKQTDTLPYPLSPIQFNKNVLSTYCVPGAGGLAPD